MSPTHLVLDHIGILTSSTEALAAFMSSLSGYTDAGPIVEDPYHGARIQFLASTASPFPRLELIEPMGGSSPLNNELERGGGVHHLCFQVKDVHGVEAWCRKTSCRKIFGPNPAPAFERDCQVVFVHSPGLGLVEFVDTPGAHCISEFDSLSVRPLTQAFLDQKNHTHDRGIS